MVGAVARPSQPRLSESTLRMFFRPTPSDADPHASPVSVSREAGTGPPPPLVLATARPRESTGVRGARRRRWWVVLAAVALCAGGANLRAHRSGSRSVAAPSLPAGATPAGIASATATTPAPPLASSAPSVGEIPPALPLTSGASAFDAVAARQALDATASAVAQCRRGWVFGPGYAIVTFRNDGAVVRCPVSPPFLGTAAGRCVAQALLQARVPPFVGDPGLVVHHFVVAAQ